MHETVPRRARRRRGALRRARHLRAAKSTPIGVRRHIGMVFQRPTPFPTMSICDNVAAGSGRAAAASVRRARETDEIVERALRRAALWDEVKDRLRRRAPSRSPAASSSGSASRARSPPSPEVLLLDEPTASLDPISTQRIEELVYELRREITIVIVTHNMQQAARVSDRTAFMLLGELIEIGADERAVHHAARSAHRSVHHRTVRMTRRWLTQQPSARIRRADRRRAARRRRATSRSGTARSRRCSSISLDGRAAHRHGAHRPSGCGKSTFLRSINRMNDAAPRRRGTKARFVSTTPTSTARRSISSRCAGASGWCSSGGIRSRSRSTTTSPTARASTASRHARGARRDRRIALRRAALWDEVKDRLRQSALGLVRRPAAAALHRARAGERARGAAARRAGERARSDRDAEDRGAAVRAEEGADDHHRHAQPAAGGARLGHDRVLLSRRLVEVGPTDRMFTSPANERTEAYITGRFG